MSVQDVVKYQDPKSLLVVNGKGKMRQLFVPIKAQCIEAVNEIPVGSYVYIDAVFLHRKHLLLYWINNSHLIPYYHFAFQTTW